MAAFQALFLLITEAGVKGTDQAFISLGLQLW